MGRDVPACLCEDGRLAFFLPSFTAAAPFDRQGGREGGQGTGCALQALFKGYLL